MTRSASDGAKYKAKSGYARKPVVFVTRYDAFRFANWLHNCQGDGDTEDGAYTLPARKREHENGGRIIPRNPAARWFLPSESEWYKAAYHKNDGVTANYWDYPTSTDKIPSSVQPPGNDAQDSSNLANYFKEGFTMKRYRDGLCVLTEVGAYRRCVSPYGTFDQGGNVAEWTEAVWRGESAVKIPGPGGTMVPYQPGAKGGNWTHDAACMSSSQRACGNPPWLHPELGDRGFRVGCVAKTQVNGDAAVKGTSCN